MPSHPSGGGPPAAAVCFRRLQTCRPTAGLNHSTASFWLAVALSLVCCTRGQSQTGDLAGSPQMRAEALRAIPFDEMTEANQARLMAVAGKPAVYRRMPVQVIGCDPDLHVFLIRYPEVIVNIWQLMDITKVQLKRTGPFSFEAADGAGTVTRVELIYGRPDLHVFYASGYYEGPLFRNRIEGDCVLLLRSSFAKRDDRVYVTNSLDVFLRMDRVGADILLKTLHPLMGKAADYNFVETAKFIGQVSQASENNGPGMERLASRLTNVDPNVRETFSRFAGVAYQRSLLRQNAQTSQPQSPAAASAAPQEGNASSGSVSSIPADPSEPPTTLRR